MTRDDMDALASWLRGNPRLTQGEFVGRFEAHWSQWLGVRDSVMVSSGTAANFVILTALVSSQSARRLRVGVPAVTWPTTVTPALLLGCDVMVFDIDRRTLGIDAKRACAAMDRGELDVLFVTHLLGFNALSTRLLEAAQRNGVVLLEDCCEAHGASFGAEKVGSFGLASSFSFYFGHHMSTIEGGVISTNDPDFADRARLMRAHGLARESLLFEEYVRQYPEIDSRFLFVEAGLNFRSTEINAFLGLRQLDILNARIEHRNQNLAAFLDGSPDWIWKDYELDGASSFALPIIAKDPDHADLARGIVDRLGIERRPIVAGNLLRQPFLMTFPIKVDGGGTPVADHVHRCGLYVGNGHHVDVAMVEKLAVELKVAG